LDKARLVWIIPEDLADFPDRPIDAVVGIKKNILTPDSLDDLIAADDLVPLLDQQEQNFEWNALQFEHASSAMEFVGLAVEFEILTEADGIVNFDRPGTHSKSPRGRMHPNVVCNLQGRRDTPDELPRPRQSYP